MSYADISTGELFATENISLSDFLKEGTNDLLIEEINKISPSEIISNMPVGDDTLDLMINISDTLSFDDYRG